MALHKMPRNYTTKIIMSQFGKKFDRAQIHHDNLKPPEPLDGDCEYTGHTRSIGIPLTDDGKATCRECQELFDEAEDRKRAAAKQRYERELAAERILGL